MKIETANQMSQFQPLSRQTLTSQITDQVRQAIVMGEISAHEALAEGQLAKRMGVSRAPIRETLVALELEGLIESQGNGRRRVCKLTTKDFDELFDMRIALESRACFLLASRITDDVVGRLEECIRQQSECEALVKLSLLDIEFHTIIAETSGNQRLFDAWLRIKPQLQLWLAQVHAQYQAVTKSTIRSTVKSHKQLLAALQSGEPKLAERTIRADLEGCVSLILRNM